MSRSAVRIAVAVLLCLLASQCAALADQAAAEAAEGTHATTVEEATAAASAGTRALPQPSEGSTYRLGDGEYLVNLEPKRQPNGKRQAFIVTESVTVRAAEPAIALVQSSHNKCRVHVIVGTLTIRNQIDRSVVRICVGTIYETTFTSRKASNIRYKDLAEHGNALPLFQTQASRTVLYKMQSQDKEIKAEMVSPPIASSYDIGESVSARFPIAPDLVAHFPPSGVMQWHDSVETVATEQNPQ